MTTQGSGAGAQDREGLIAFYSNRDGNYEIYSIRPDGSDLKRLTFDPASDQTPAWSPDGTRIASSSLSDGNRDIYVVNDEPPLPHAHLCNAKYLAFSWV